MEKVYITQKLANTLMDTLFCLAYSVTEDIEQSEHYTKSRFVYLLKEFEVTNDFEFVIEEEEKIED